MTEVELRDRRLRAKTDLFWLAKDILGYDLVEDVHKVVAEFFVKKDPAKPLHEQDELKSRLLLDARGSFKTSLDVADIVQWILTFPDIRILLNAGALALSEEILGEVQSHFIRCEKLHEIFPEFQMTDRDMKVREFTVPCREIFKKEPTVAVASLNSMKAGFHYDVIKGDDIVNEVNSKTPQQREETKRDWKSMLPLLEPYGFKDLIGTRYAYDDLYGDAIDSGEYKVFHRAAFVPPLTPDCKITFPRDARGIERNSYALLMKKRKEMEPFLFNCQYLNDPKDEETNEFTEEMFLKRTIPDTQIPKYLKNFLTGHTIRGGRMFTTWDLAFSEETHADFTVGVTGLYDQFGRLFIVDLVRGRFNPWELKQQILLQMLKWKPWLSAVAIEKAGGSQLIQPSLVDDMRRLRLDVQIDWIKVDRRRKRERVMALQPLLRDGDLWFSHALPFYKDMIKEFVRFGSYGHDDIPDAMSRLIPYKMNTDHTTRMMPANFEIPMLSARSIEGSSLGVLNG